MLNIPVILLLTTAIYAAVNYVTGQRKIKKVRKQICKVIKIDEMLSLELDDKLGMTLKQMQAK